MPLLHPGVGVLLLLLRLRLHLHQPTPQLPPTPLDRALVAAARRASTEDTRPQPLRPPLRAPLRRLNPSPSGLGRRRTMTRLLTTVRPAQPHVPLAMAATPQPASQAPRQAAPTLVLRAGVRVGAPVVLAVALASAGTPEATAAAATARRTQAAADIMMLPEPLELLEVLLQLVLRLQPTRRRARLLAVVEEVPVVSSLACAPCRRRARSAEVSWPAAERCGALKGWLGHSEPGSCDASA
jgi:hypothetical protein